ncbi:DUF3616 domain-containing protein [Candidatus Accumulibacter sp. ACC003]|uniref:DUF3616 domain-containing protein n=1 Tax=Candidatus Accumulibacter sp. ACC003 TaxID=2823334 RepID=UPI0025BE458F|nr:DUF3616 domain-containing protein [Candidatus Accumulibacter sp. ACC003]
MALNDTPSFRPLTGTYEPSGIQQLADGRFIVVEDELQQPLSVLEIDADGSVRCTPLHPSGVQQAGDDFWDLDDLEGVTVDQAGYVYAITSHSRDGDGREKASRERLVRFRVAGDRVAEPLLAPPIKAALIAAQPLLAAAAKIPDVKKDGGLNIEALAMSADQRRLLIGLRSPLLEQRAIIASIENPQAIFDSHHEPSISATLVTLDLGGKGIRGMSYLAVLNGYLVIAGPLAKEQEQFELWFWSGDPAAPSRRVSVAGLAGFEHAEGVSSALIDGRQRIIIVSDDGSRTQGRFARFLLLDPDQLQIE